MIAKLFVRIIFDIFVIKRVFVLLLCILPILSISAQDRTLPDKDFILVINTYAEISPWSNRIISQATEFVREHPNLTLYSEHLSMLLIDTDTIVNVFKQTLFEKYAGHQPKMLLLLGNTPMMMRDDFRAAWGDIPIILCSEKDYVGTTENYLEKEVTSPADRIPISSLSEDYNLTFMHADLFIRENVEMMFHIIPNMKKFIFVSDLRYINQVNDAEIREILHANYPKTEYQHLSTKEFTVTQLIDSLNTIDTKTTGVMFASWFFKRTFAGNTSLVPNSEQIIASSSAPLFTLNMLDILNARNGMLGGYVYDQDNFNQALHRNLQEICDGKQARDIPFYLPSDGMAVLNYELLIKKGLNPSMVPSNTVFINRPPSFWEQYKIPFSVCCVGLFIIILLIRIRVFKRVRMLQQREINTMTIYKNLIDNMPIIYMQHELIKDESGRPIDMICRNVNTLFGYKLYSREEAIGKKFSELSPDMCTDFIPFIQMALSEGKAITFPYFFK